MSDSKTLLEQIESGEAKATEREEDALIGKRSPARSDSNNIRNLGKMGTAKFEALLAEMETYEQADPEAFKAVREEAMERGIPF